jgi:hypothetical protein
MYETSVQQSLLTGRHVLPKRRLTFYRTTRRYIPQDITSRFYSFLYLYKCRTEVQIEVFKLLYCASQLSETSSLWEAVYVTVRQTKRQRTSD